MPFNQLPITNVICSLNALYVNRICEKRAKWWRMKHLHTSSSFVDIQHYIGIAFLHSDSPPSLVSSLGKHRKSN